MIRILTPMVVLAVTATLSGCAVLKTPDPVQTYRFGAAPVFARTETAPHCEPIPVSLRRIDFDNAARGDRLLTVTGAETAYIGTARWVSQAETLFHSSLEDAFAAGAPCVRLASGAFARDGLLLSVDVRRFETVYAAAAGAVPDVRVSVAVHLTNRERDVVASNRFDSVESAGENRVASIVAAYERANADVTRKIVEWTATETAVVR